MASVDLDDLLSNEQTATLLGIKPNTPRNLALQGQGSGFHQAGKSSRLTGPLPALARDGLDRGEHLRQHK